MNWLRGTWKIKRKVTQNNNGNLIGYVELGTAIFSTCSESIQLENLNCRPLHYLEKGTFVQQDTGKGFLFKREYLYVFSSENVADVLFYEPDTNNHLKFFHRLNFDKKVITAKHLCINDLYETKVQVKNEKGFETAWKVTGPNKNYSIHTLYDKKST